MGARNPTGLSLAIALPLLFATPALADPECGHRTCRQDAELRAWLRERGLDFFQYGRHTGDDRFYHSHGGSVAGLCIANGPTVRGTYHSVVWRNELWNGRAGMSEEERGGFSPVCLNLVYVSSDETRDDVYGRQIERATSCIIWNTGGAHGKTAGATRTRRSLPSTATP